MWLGSSLLSSPTLARTWAGYDAEFSKKIGDGQGNITSDTYIMSGGVFTKQVEAKSNVEGDSEQSVAIYTIKWSNSPRVIT